MEGWGNGSQGREDNPQITPIFMGFRNEGRGRGDIWGVRFDRAGFAVHIFAFWFRGEAGLWRMTSDPVNPETVGSNGIGTRRRRSSFTVKLLTVAIVLIA